MFRQLLFIVSIASVLSCEKKNKGNTSTSTDPVKFPVSAGIIDEASGMADSKRNTGYLWIHEDSGTPPQLALMSHKGEFLKKIPIRGIVNRDWEDMALAKGPDASQNYIYIGEIGDNSAQYPQCYLYRFPEPSKEATEIAAVETIAFKYADGPRDAEAFIIDPDKGDIYIITKRETQSKIYKIAAPYSLTAVNTATATGTLAYNSVVSAALTPDGKGVAVKTYSAIYFYPRSSNETLETTLAKPFTTLPYETERQGEAMTFTNDNIGYFTLGERAITDVTLNYYKR